MLVPIKKIRANPFNERQTVDDLKPLVRSIKQRGFWGSLLARAVENRFEVAFGMRRLRAAEEAGIETIELDVRDIKDQEMMELSTMENIHRSDVPVMERARHFKKYRDAYKRSTREMENIFGIPQATLKDYFLLVDKVSGTTQRAIEKGKIGWVKALEAHRIGGEKLVKEAIAQNLSQEEIRERNPRSLKKANEFLSKLDKSITPVQYGNRVGSKLFAAGVALEEAMKNWDVIPTHYQESIRLYVNKLRKLISEFEKI